MESEPEFSNDYQAEPKKSSFPIWVIIVIAVIVVPVLCVCLAVVVIAAVTMMGPIVGNTFSSINQSLP